MCLKVGRHYGLGQQNFILASAMILNRVLVLVHLLPRPHVKWRCHIFSVYFNGLFIHALLFGVI
jgi:hypothetical protein